MDACLFLLDNGVSPDRITWVKPRESWYWNRAKAQAKVMEARKLSKAELGDEGYATTTAASAEDGDFEFGGHTKFRLTGQSFPSDSLYRDLAGSDSLELAGDLRLNLEWDRDAWSFDANYQLIGLHSDYRLAALPNDDRRLFNLTDVIDDTNDTAILHRLDRLWIGYASEKTVLRIGRPVDGAARRRHEQLPWQDGLEQRVHAGDRIAYRHRMQGVTVITAAQRHEAALVWPALGVPELNGHLQRHLDRDGSGVGKEHQLEARRGDLDQFFRQRNGRWMGQSTEHHMRHLL